jgi:hypothetical protein
LEGITNSPEALFSHTITATVSPSTLYLKGSSPKANEGTKAMQRRTRLIDRVSFINAFSGRILPKPQEEAELSFVPVFQAILIARKAVCLFHALLRHPP